MNALAAWLLTAGLAGLLSLCWNQLLQGPLEAGMQPPSAPQALAQNRSLLADYALRKAADYYHSGALPTIFALGSAGDDTESYEEEGEEHGHNKFDEFLKHFYPTGHTHLDSGGATGQPKNLVSEVLPWLWLASRLEPAREYPYIEACFWLRRFLRMPREAEAFLRDGFRNNPNSPGICLELGKVAYLDHGNIEQARFYLTRAFDLYEANPELRNEGYNTFGQLLGLLAQLEEEDRQYLMAVKYLNILLNYTPNPEAIRAWSIDMQLKVMH